jgi:hypothetical protein
MDRSRRSRRTSGAHGNQGSANLGSVRNASSVRLVKNARTSARWSKVNAKPLIRPSGPAEVVEPGVVKPRLDAGPTDVLDHVLQVEAAVAVEALEALGVEQIGSARSRAISSS